MSLLDKIKDLLRGSKDSVKSGIDKGSDAIEKRVSPEHAKKVEQGADKVKDVVDKLD